MSCTTSALGGGYTVDIYSKTISYSKSGQAIDNWQKVRTISGSFMPARAEERLVGRVQNPVGYLFMTHDKVDVSEQARNLKDRDGEVIDAGSFNIVGVRPVAGWSKVDHYTLNLQRVLD